MPQTAPRITAEQQSLPLGSDPAVRGAGDGLAALADEARRLRAAMSAISMGRVMLAQREGAR